MQTHEEHDNSMRTRTIGAIALRPTGNDQGGHYFLSLLTGRRLNRSKATPLPMPAEVIQRVHFLARNNPTDLTFLNRNDQPFDDDYMEDPSDDVSITSTKLAVAHHSSVDVYPAGVSKTYDIDDQRTHHLLRISQEGRQEWRLTT